MKITKSAIEKRVNAFIGTERTSKLELSKLSRDLLTYVYDDFAAENKCNDTPMINRLIDGLTPANKRVACQFFPKFLGWDWDKENQKFLKKSKGKVYDKKLAEAKQALEDPDFNMWSWYEAKGVKPEKAPVDHKKKLGNALKAGLNAEGDAKLSISDIATVLFAQGVSMRNLMKAAEAYATIQDIE